MSVSPYAPRPYIVEVILPSGEVHLLGGPSGAGKTRWLLHNLLLWEQGEPFLGHRSHPVPWVYVAADRSIASVRDTLTGMGIDPKRIEIIKAWDQGMSINAILDAITLSKAKLVVWESFGSFIDPPGQGKQVKEFLARISKFCRQLGITIIGIVESPKMKPYERYENPRQRISGAASWAHFSETVMLVESDPGSGEDPEATRYRTLYICPRNAPMMRFDLAFDDNGRLLPLEAEDLDDFLSKRKKKSRK